VEVRRTLESDRSRLGVGSAYRFSELGEIPRCVGYCSSYDTEARKLKLWRSQRIRRVISTPSEHWGRDLPATLARDLRIRVGGAPWLLNVQVRKIVHWVRFCGQVRVAGRSVALLELRNPSPHRPDLQRALKRATRKFSIRPGRSRMSFLLTNADWMPVGRLVPHCPRCFWEKSLLFWDFLEPPVGFEPTTC